MSDAVLILQHQTQDHPAYLRTWLADAGVPHVVLNSEIGQAYPRSIDGWLALAVLGGEYGANDDRASLRDAERLIEQALARDVPVLGHCLGGQLMARVLGAAVRRAAQPEIGWLPIEWLEREAVDGWFGDDPPERVFQWHYDAFELPSGATALARSPACEHQAFAYGRHLAMQFHVEVDAAKLDEWLRASDASYAAARHAWPLSVQPAAEVRQWSRECLERQQRLADRIYRRWAGPAGSAVRESGATG